MPSVLFVSDFDGTLTKKDTTHLSFQSTKKFQYGTQSERTLLSQEIKEKGKNYYNRYKSLVNSLLEQYDTDLKRTTEQLEQFLNEIDRFNLDSRCNLAKEKYFDDFIYENVDELKEEIEFHPHAMETLENLQKQSDIDCKILSVNWFPELLNACVGDILEEDAVVTSELPLLKGNNIDFGRVSTAQGKGEWIRKWNNEYRCCSVYLGDTLTDLSALMEADYGIIFGSNKELIEVTNLFNIQVAPLSSLIEEKGIGGRTGTSEQGHCDNEGNEKCLYSTSSWEDVERLVLSLPVLTPSCQSV